MVSVLPMIEEININDDNNNIDMFLLNKEQINKANEEYRLCRNKPLPDSKNYLRIMYEHQRYYSFFFLIKSIHYINDYKSVI